MAGATGQGNERWQKIAAVVRDLFTPDIPQPKAMGDFTAKVNSLRERGLKGDVDAVEVLGRYTTWFVEDSVKGYTRETKGYALKALLDIAESNTPSSSEARYKLSHALQWGLHDTQAACDSALDLSGEDPKLMERIIDAAGGFMLDKSQNRNRRFVAMASLISVLESGSLRENERSCVAYLGRLLADAADELRGDLLTPIEILLSPGSTKQYLNDARESSRMASRLQDNPLIPQDLVPGLREGLKPRDRPTLRPEIYNLLVDKVVEAVNNAGLQVKGEEINTVKHGKDTDRGLVIIRWIKAIK